MKALITLALLLLNLPALESNAANWTQKASFNGGNRYGAFCFSIGNTGYVGCGVQQTGINYALVNDLWAYDPASDSWTQKASKPAPGLSAAAVFTAAGKAYLTTGYDLQVYRTETWEYDPATNSWSSRSPYPGGARYTCAAFGIGNYGFVGMGYNGSTLSDFYRYNALTDTWTSIAPIPGPSRQSAKGFSSDIYGYVLGGADGNGMYNSKEMWRYDPIGDVWAQMTDYPGIGSHGMAGFIISDKIYAGTGAVVGSSNPVNNDFYCYDPVLNSWNMVPDFSGGIRQGTASMTIGSKGYVGMGSSVIFPSLNYFSDWWTFEVPTGIQEPDASLNVQAYFTGNESLHFEFGRPLSGTGTIIIYDASGKEIKTVSTDNMQERADISLNNPASSVYLYSILEAGNILYKGKVAYIK
jgi:N-acetylneuraminic acid mutarotase